MIKLFLKTPLFLPMLFLTALLSAGSLDIQSSDKLHHDVIVDSKMTFSEALTGTKAPQKLIDSLVLLDVVYLSVDKKKHAGQILINKSVRQDVEFFFDFLLRKEFIIEKVKPIVIYNWSDVKSMEDNNSSAFNYRNIEGTNRLSNHAFGRAIDINPQWNPVIHKDGRVSPENGKYDIKRNGTFYQNHEIVREMKSRGWRWGGDFSSYADNHHFDKLK